MKLEKDAKAWLEPMQEWLNAVSNLDETAQSNDLSSKKSSLQKIFGSNLTLSNRRILECPCPPYAALRAARQKSSENKASIVVVRREGFEPSKTEVGRFTVCPR